MTKLIFNFKKIKNIILCSLEEKMIDIFKRFASKEHININEFVFLYNNKIIEDNLTLAKIITQEDKKSEFINIIVEKKIQNSHNNINKNIICPICKENIFIEIKDYKIHLNNCINGHKLEFLFKDFCETQKSIYFESGCDFCKIKNKNNLNNNELFQCITCGNILCHSCEIFHNKNHKINSYFNELSIKDCNTSTNISNIHKENNDRFHNTILKNKMSEFKQYIDKFKKNIKEILNKLKNVMDNLDLYYNISSNYISDENVNFESTKNINEFIKYNDIVLKDIKEIILDENLENKIKKIMNIFKKMNNKYSNYIIAEIEIKEGDLNKNIRIINSFEQCKKEEEWEDEDDDCKCENEKEIKENCEIKINDEIIPFSYFHKFSKIGKYKIQYSFKNNLTRLSCMFQGCKALTNMNLSNFKSQDVTNMVSMFRDCDSLKNINLSNLNTTKVSDMSAMFYGCNSLMSINLSDFDTKSVRNLSFMFYECSSLVNVDISNFTIAKDTNTSNMFSKCNSLAKIYLTNLNLRILLTWLSCSLDIEL